MARRRAHRRYGSSVHIAKCLHACASIVLVAACAGGQAELGPPPEPAQSVDTPAPTQPLANAAPDVAPDFAPLVLEIAASFGTWGAVDNQFHWAPGLCAMPAEAVQHISGAPAQTAHGEKVFVLHALDALAYWKATAVKMDDLPRSLARTAGPLATRKDVEQVLVKESFAPREVSDGFIGARMVPAIRGDERFTAGDPIGLFIMAKLAGAPAGTDDGWIYATVAPSGDVTAAGFIAACRDCHAKEADRVFGVPLHWKT
jgi:hypothetical protein